MTGRLVAVAPQEGFESPGHESVVKYPGEPDTPAIDPPKSACQPSACLLA